MIAKDAFRSPTDSLLIDLHHPRPDYLVGGVNQKIQDGSMSLRPAPLLIPFHS